MILLRGTFATVSALLITALLCLVAPFISNKQKDSVREAAIPVQVAQIVQEHHQKQKRKQEPVQPKKPPRFPRPAQHKPQPPEQIAIPMAPLKMEFPSLHAATLPVMLPEADPVEKSGFDASRTFDLSMVDKPPRLQKYAPPLYPAVAKGKRIEGKITLRCTVTAKGRVKDAKVLSAKPSGYFEKAALQAVTTWTFIPARYQGKKVPVYVDIPLTFSLD